MAAASHASCSFSAANMEKPPRPAADEGHNPVPLPGELLILPQLAHVYVHVQIAAGEELPYDYEQKQQPGVAALATVLLRIAEAVLIEFAYLGSIY